ncbi:MAG: threonine--tRNA ligase, partial [Aeromicrobium sp.]|nr:threonine--tRNA ligase [Aeromicrobium sp.]
MSEISIVVPSTSSGSNTSQQVDAGTKAWQLFAEQPEIIAARINGELRDLAYEL